MGTGMTKEFIALFNVKREEVIAAAEFNDEAALTFQDQTVAQFFRDRAEQLRGEAKRFFP